VQDAEVHVVRAGKLIGISQSILGFRREVCRKDDSVWVHSWDGFVLKRTFAGGKYRGFFFNGLGAFSV